MNVHSLISVVGCAGAGLSDLSKRSNDSEETHQSSSFISANARHTIEDDSPCFPTITAHRLTANVQAERPASYLVLPFTPQALLLGQEDVLPRLKTSSVGSFREAQVTCGPNVRCLPASPSKPLFQASSPRSELHEALPYKYISTRVGAKTYFVSSRILSNI